MGSDDTSDQPWRVRGIRGATTVPHNTPDEIRLATHELLDEMVRRNAIQRDDVASAYFTTTPDLDAEFPATTSAGTTSPSCVATKCPCPAACANVSASSCTSTANDARTKSNSSTCAEPAPSAQTSKPLRAIRARRPSSTAPERSETPPCL